MTVDVVIPAYERTALLNEAVASVLAQTYQDWRLTIVDDASRQPLASSLNFSDNRIRIVRLNTNVGPGLARNAGVAVGSNPIVAFLDSDDLWRADKLEKQVTYFKEHDASAWQHTNELWLREGVTVKQRSQHRKEGGRFLERAFERCLISPSSVALRRNFFEKHGGFASAFYVCEDFELWLRLLADREIGFIDEPLAIKRAGTWVQLSATREIDRARVLALHRFYRFARGDAGLIAYLPALLGEAQKKCDILVRGAIKYGHTTRARRYQAWLTLFTTLRTRPMRWSSRAVSRY